MANSSSSSRRPTITLPPKPTLENLFNPAGGPTGFSPGPMTLLSSFLDTPSSDGSGWSFSQLLAGAIASSPHVNSSVSATQLENSCSAFKNEEVKEENCSNTNDSSNSEGYRGNRPMSLTISSSPMFVIPSGLTPSGLLNSPALFSPGQMSPFGMSHQQALAQVTAQAALAQSQMQMSGYQTSFAESSETLENNYPGTTDVNTHQHMPSLTSETMMESSDVSNSDRKIEPTSLTIDKPADDGYNWRKYGQKQVKGSEYPRSYYKCTHLTCPVKKKVERSIEGQVIEIIYKGQHNHEPPPTHRRAKESTGDLNGNNAMPLTKPEFDRSGQMKNSSWSNETVPGQLVPGKDLESSQLTSLPTKSGNTGKMENNGPRYEKMEKGDEPNSKRRNTGASESVPSHKTVTEARIIVQTRSEVDLLDDGYKWRKYGQKVVKGNPHPRSYYKCTSPECPVRKHIERAATDPKAVITTYEGKHNHDVPAGRHSGHNIASSNASNLKSQKAVAVLQLKEEIKV